MYNLVMLFVYNYSMRERRERNLLFSSKACTRAHICSNFYFINIKILICIT